MAEINGVDMPNFTKKEIPDDKAKFMDEQILRRTQMYRDVLNCPFNISLNNDALVRFHGRKTSHHRVIVDPSNGIIIKKSTAIDGFPKCDMFKAWSISVQSKLFGGVGVYFDTKNNHGEPQPMLHHDLRTNPLIWLRDKDTIKTNGGYMFQNEQDFYKRLRNLLMIHSL